MRPKISAFPKCYLDRIAGERTMTVFEWIEMARSLAHLPAVYEHGKPDQKGRQ